MKKMNYNEVKQEAIMLLSARKDKFYNFYQLLQNEQLDTDELYNEILHNDEIHTLKENQLKLRTLLFKKHIPKSLENKSETEIKNWLYETNRNHLANEIPILSIIKKLNEIKIRLIELNKDEYSLLSENQTKKMLSKLTKWKNKTNVHNTIIMMMSKNKLAQIQNYNYLEKKAKAKLNTDLSKVFGICGYVRFLNYESDSIVNEDGKSKVVKKSYYVYGKKPISQIKLFFLSNKTMTTEEYYTQQKEAIMLQYHKFGYKVRKGKLNRRIREMLKDTEQDRINKIMTQLLNEETLNLIKRQAIPKMERQPYTRGYQSHLTKFVPDEIYLSNKKFLPIEN